MVRYLHCCAELSPSYEVFTKNHMPKGAMISVYVLFRALVVIKNIPDAWYLHFTAMLFTVTFNANYFAVLLSFLCAMLFY